MLKKILLALIVLIALFFLEFQQTLNKNKSIDRITDLPWQVSINEDGSSTVFNQTIGKSTLSDFQKHVKREPTISLFRDQDTSLSLEALFEKIDFGGIISNVILKLEVPEKELVMLEKNALRKKVMPTGAYELKLSTETETKLANKTIASLSYIPTSIQLDAEMIKLRFGEPDDIINTDDKISHFLYPKIGLDIILNLNKRAKEVFQYVNPADFDRLQKKLYGVQRSENQTMR